MVLGNTEHPEIQPTCKVCGTSLVGIPITKHYKKGNERVGVTVCSRACANVLNGLKSHSKVKK